MKAWIIVAICLVVAGSLVFVAVMSVNKWDFMKLSTTKFVTATHEINEDFENIYIEAGDADVSLCPSDDGVCRVVCKDEEKITYTVSVSDGALSITSVDNRKWYEHISIGISTDSSKVSVYLPKSEYAALGISCRTGDVDMAKGLSFRAADISITTGDVECLANVSGLLKIEGTTGDVTVEALRVGALDVKVSTGDVELSDVTSAGEVNIKVSTGDVELSGVNCKGLSSDGNTGDISLENVVAAEKFNIVRTTGDITLEGCDAAEIFIKTDTGDVSGSLLSEKIFAAKTNTGDVRVPSSTTGGVCEIETNTGDIKINIG